MTEFAVQAISDDNLKLIATDLIAEVLRKRDHRLDVGTLSLRVVA